MTFCRCHEDTGEDDLKTFVSPVESQLCLYHICVHIYLHKVCLCLTLGLFSLAGGSWLLSEHYHGQTTVLDLQPSTAAVPHSPPLVLLLTVTVEERRR